MRCGRRISTFEAGVGARPAVVGRWASLATGLQRDRAFAGRGSTHAAGQEASFTAAKVSVCLARWLPSPL
jgi:hypothetical protein